MRPRGAGTEGGVEVETELAVQLEPVRQNLDDVHPVVSLGVDLSRLVLVEEVVGDDQSTLVAGQRQVVRILAALEQAYVERDPGLVNLAVEPAFDPMRGQARFRALPIGCGSPRRRSVNSQTLGVDDSR